MGVARWHPGIWGRQMAGGTLGAVNTLWRTPGHEYRGRIEQGPRRWRGKPAPWAHDPEGACHAVPDGSQALCHTLAPPLLRGLALFPRLGALGRPRRPGAAAECGVTRVRRRPREGSGSTGNRVAWQGLRWKRGFWSHGSDRVASPEMEGPPRAGDC